MVDKPAEVEVKNAEPIDVSLVGVAPGAATPGTEAVSGAKAAAATAKVDADALATEGQRAINRLWERTQAIIAISVVETTLIVVAILIVAPLWKASVDQAQATAAVTGLVLLSNLVGNVTGFYFSRTNHTKTGGVGPTRGE
jgi:hypothetical protein